MILFKVIIKSSLVLLKQVQIKTRSNQARWWNKNMDNVSDLYFKWNETHNYAFCDLLFKVNKLNLS